MILNNDRDELDTALSDDFSICVLRGSVDSTPGSVHNCLEGNWGPQPWNRWFLITNPDLLTDEEVLNWFGDNPGIDYVFLGRLTKTITSNGSAKNDLLVDGECDFIMYYDKFSEADMQ